MVPDAAMEPGATARRVGCPLYARPRVSSRPCALGWSCLLLRVHARAIEVPGAPARSHLVPSPMELFAHATHFFGYKIVLLGRFNGQVPHSARCRRPSCLNCEGRSLFGLVHAWVMVCGSV